MSSWHISCISALVSLIMRAWRPILPASRLPCLSARFSCMRSSSSVSCSSLFSARSRSATEWMAPNSDSMAPTWPSDEPRALALENRLLVLQLGRHRGKVLGHRRPIGCLARALLLLGDRRRDKLGKELRVRIIGSRRWRAGRRRRPVHGLAGRRRRNRGQLHRRRPRCCSSTAHPCPSRRQAAVHAELMRPDAALSLTIWQADPSWTRKRAAQSAAAHRPARRAAAR